MYVRVFVTARPRTMVALRSCGLAMTRRLSTTAHILPMVSLLIYDSTSTLDDKQDVAQRQVPASPKDGLPAVAAHRGGRGRSPFSNAFAWPTVVQCEQRFKIFLCFLVLITVFWANRSFFIGVGPVKRVNRARLQLSRPNELSAIAYAWGHCGSRIHH